MAQREHFTFFRLVQLLQRAVPGSVPPGHQGPFGEEAVRFCSNPSLAFPLRDVERVTYQEQTLLPSATSLRALLRDLDMVTSPEQASGLPPFLMMVNFLGLYGPTSPLPTFYTEAILHTDVDEDVQRHFLDLFQHRLISLFYRCWEKYRYYAQYQPQARDPLSQWFLALIGVGKEEQEQGDHLAWYRLLPYLGFLSMRTTSPTTLAHLVSHYFSGVAVHIDQYVGRWVTVTVEQQNALGLGNHRLGEDCILGDRVYDYGGKFRLVVGPVVLLTFARFLPAGSYYYEIRALVQFALHDQLEFDVAIVLRTEDVPPLRLADEQWGRLGWSCWLGEPQTSTVSVTFPGDGAFRLSP